LKITYITFTIGCLAIAGFPGLSGFFSKDAILLSVFAHNKILYALALFGAMLTAFYMFRLLFITFNGSFRGTKEQEHHLHESPPAMTIPLIVLAVLSVIGGFVGIPEVLMHGGDRLTAFLAPVVGRAAAHGVTHSQELILMVVATALVAGAVLLAWILYRKYRSVENKGFAKVLENKWYVDELYDTIIVKPLQALGKGLNEVMEKSGIDGIVNGVGKSVQYGSRQLRLLQSGQVGNYILLMVVSILLFFVIQFFIRK
jgi:NADH-quinone oxidoreductase subunit L